MFAPELQRHGSYLLPIVIGLPAKQPSAVFPALLLAWTRLFEEEDFLAVVRACLLSSSRVRWRSSF
jgi:hypothetical protein